MERITQYQIDHHFKSYISQCRPGDWEHAKRVVEWVKYLGEERDDLELLKTAGYLHDIGWYKLVPSGRKLSKEGLLELQEKANIQTETLVGEILETLFFNKSEISKILRLIKATESYEATNDDEKILVDADSLSKTNPDHVKEKYLPGEWLNMCSLFEEKLPQRISTKKGQAIFPKKLTELRTALENELNNSKQ